MTPMWSNGSGKERRPSKDIFLSTNRQMHSEDKHPRASEFYRTILHCILQNSVYFLCRWPKTMNSTEGGGKSEIPPKKLLKPENERKKFFRFFRFFFYKKNA